jgi:hypothetical protein
MESKDSPFLHNILCVYWYDYIISNSSSSFIYSKKPRFYIFFFFNKKFKYNIVGTVNQFFFYRFH